MSFFVTLKTKDGHFDHFDPSANSETKEATTMKLCTVIAYYITSINKQLKFLNSRCFIVCSVVCLVAKNELKHDRIFKFFEIKRIHEVDSPFNEDPKNVIFFQRGPNFGEGRP